MGRDLSIVRSIGPVMDVLSDFQRLIDRIRERNLHASFRRWIAGDTVFVGADRCTHGEIIGFARAIYVGQRPHAAWYAFDFYGETDDAHTEDEVVDYVVSRLTATNEEYLAETKRRATRSRIGG